MEEEKYSGVSRQSSGMSRPKTAGSLQGRPLTTSSRKISSGKGISGKGQANIKKYNDETNDLSFIIDLGSRPSSAKSVVAWNESPDESIEEENSNENEQNDSENEHLDDYDVEQLLKNEDTSSFTVIL